MGPHPGSAFPGARAKCAWLVPGPTVSSENLDSPCHGPALSRLAWGTSVGRGAFWGLAGLTVTGHLCIFPFSDGKFISELAAGAEFLLLCVCVCVRLTPELCCVFVIFWGLPLSPWKAHRYKAASKSFPTGSLKGLGPPTGGDLRASSPEMPMGGERAERCGFWARGGFCETHAGRAAVQEAPHSAGRAREGLVSALITALPMGPGCVPTVGRGLAFCGSLRGVLSPCCCDSHPRKQK